MTPCFNVVLVEPEIPQNTGNVARTCAVTGAALHLVEPLGFSITDRTLKRAGLDYWGEVCVGVYKSFEELRAKNPDASCYFATTKGGAYFHEMAFKRGDFLVFGKETKGLPPELLAQNTQNCMRIPMREGMRSMNLSNSVAVVLYEALRQIGYDGLI